AQWLDAGEAFLEVLAVALDGSSEGPEVHAVRSEADGAAATAGAERQDLVEAVEQARPLFGLDEPLELRPVSSEFRLGEPAPQEREGLVLESRIGVDALETVGGQR